MGMEEELVFDVLEQILIQLDVEDLIRCKSVCKSWHCFISSPCFVKAHLNHAYTIDRNNPQLGHRRICFPVVLNKSGPFYSNHWYMVGSYNGLVCVSPRDVEFIVTNPSTREEMLKLPTPPFLPEMHKIGIIRQVVCWGFGYDSSLDDYKVIAGFSKNLDEKRTRFYALNLKSNTWKVIGEIMYKSIVGRSGVLLCGGILHWFMIDRNNKRVIISLDISTHEFKVITTPLPDKYDYFENLGVIEDCLCIHYYPAPHTRNIWILKNNKWELYNHRHSEGKYDVAHHLTAFDYVVDDGRCVPSNGEHVGTFRYVKSLVSPHPRHVNSNGNNYDGQKRITKQGEEGNESVESCRKGNIIIKRKRKRNKMRKRKMSCKHILKASRLTWLY